MMDITTLFERFPALHNLRGHVHRRIPILRQVSAGDCGAAALAMVLAYHDTPVALDELTQALGIHRDGADATALLRVAKTYGLRGRAVSVDLEDLDKLPAGAVLYWQFRHFVVLEAVRRQHVDIVDPSFGRRRVAMATFGRAFTGIALVFEPTAAAARRPAHKRVTPAMSYAELIDGRLLTRTFAVSILMQLLSAGLPLMTGILIDQVIPQRDYSLLYVLAAGYSLFHVFSTLAGFVRAQLLIYLRTHIEVRLTLRFVDHLTALPYAFFQQHTTGDLLVRLGSNNAIRDILTSTALSAILDGTMAMTTLAVLSLANVRLTAMVIALAAARVIVLAIARQRQRQLLAENLENAGRAQTSQVEMLAGMETLKAMGLEMQAAQDWSNVFIDGLNISIQRGRLDALFNALLAGLGGISSLVLTFYGAALVLRGDMSLGTMLAFTALAAAFLSNVTSLMSTGFQLQMLEVFVASLNDVFQTAPEQACDMRRAPAVLAGSIALEKISFAYGSQAPLVIDDVSLEVQPGMRVALVGPTGSGKSTLARLMVGLYEPRAGRVLFDGRDFRELDRHVVRRQLGIVTQDSQLFSGTIRRNIGLADPQLRMDRIVWAAKMAAIHDEIAAMPLGYETLLTDRGLSLSGGQRQRLAIARAIVGEPKILILDEATSHLDATTEARINRHLASLRCTRLVVAHRISTIADADLILVLDHGRVIERGSHEYLLSLNGLYARLFGALAQAGSIQSMQGPSSSVAVPLVRN
jgi:ATP-binding cassette subfamily B protein